MRSHSVKTERRQLLDSIVKTEWMKERRSANKKLLVLAPFIFIAFSYLMTLLMGTAEAGRSYLVAAAFNWYPGFILPVIATLLVSNMVTKEKPVNRVLFRSLNIDMKQQALGKNIVVVLELWFILLVSTLLLVLVGTLIGKETISVGPIFLATLSLFFGTLPYIGITFVLSRFLHPIVIVIIHFLTGNVAALAATEGWWVFYPWCYNTRMMAPILEIHPNGTFLVEGDPLLSMSSVPVAMLLSVGVYGLTILLQVLLAKGADKG